VVRSDCELVDVAGRSRAALGRRLVVRPLRGRLAVRLPGRQRSVPLEDELGVPLPAALDATHGTVRLTEALGAGRTRSATLAGGRVLVRQRHARGAPAALRVLRPSGSRCAGASGRLLARVTVSSHGSLRTSGRLATATGRAATWVTEERCAGTRVRVRRGRVAIFDRATHRHLRLGAGRSYLARAR